VVSILEISEAMIGEINNEITVTFQPIYTKYIKEKKDIDFETYLHSVIGETWGELQNLMEITNDTLYPVAKRRQVTKKRWVKKELEDNKKSGFTEEIDNFAKRLYEKAVEENNFEGFKSFYKVDTFEELRENKLQELEEWELEDDKLMCQFPYLKYKTWKQIDSALSNDMKYILIKRMMEKYPKGEQNAVVSVPNYLTEFPYDHTNRAKIGQHLVDGKYFQSVYMIDDKTQFDTRLNVEALEEGLMRENLKMLNLLDQQILVYLMSLKHEALYQPIPMVVEIGEIVRNVYDNRSVKSYNAVKESLIKMDFMENRVIDGSTLRTTKSEIFFSVKIEVDEVTKKEVARIIFSETLINDYVKNQTVSIYKKVIDGFTLNSSKILFFALQRQRIVSASQAKEGDEIWFQTNLNFFRGALVFGTSRRANQIKLIEESLNEIVENKATLKSYKRKGDVFLLEFYPFSERERIDLLNNKAPEKFLLQRTVETPDDKSGKQLKLDLSS
jgi:hypothetical protein